MSDIMIKSMPSSIRPRERLLSVGASNLSDEELISIILRSGYKSVNVKSLSNSLLTNIDGIKNLKEISVKELSNIKGIGLTKAISIIASIELGKRVYSYNEDKVKLNKPNIIYEKFKYLFMGKKQEYFYTLYLDNSNNLIESKLLFIGTIDSASVHPREIFKGAVKLSASSIILMHNHPSDNLNPSINDLEFTDNINELSKMMGIKLLDHIIFGENNYFSFKEFGYLRK